MGKALYRKYRSRSLSEIVGQEHVTTTLGNALAAGKIAHAYLLTGPRGVGKTSIARILAHEINGLPYSEEPHFDIIEIDAASNNGVEDVRDLRDKIMSAPTSATYKVFIIDEVHMLSKAAFNALLKTLEEPPAHVVFILATTEAHKLPATIISRTQRYSFRPVAATQVIAHLQTIAGKEKIDIDEAALELIAEHGEGSFRDSISLLDQASSLGKHVSRADVERLLGRASTEQIESLLTAVEAHDAAGALAILRALFEQGYEAAMVAVQLGQSIRPHIVEKPHHLAFLRDLLDVPPAYNPQAVLEITVLRHGGMEERTPRGAVAAKEVGAQREPRVSSAQSSSGDGESLESQKSPPEAPEQTPATTPQTNDAKEPAQVAQQAQTAPVELPESPELPENPSPPLPAAKPSGDTAGVADDNIWPEVLQRLKATHNTLYGIARMAQPSLDGDTLLLTVTFAFHLKRLKEPRNHAILAGLVETVRGASTQIAYVQAVQPQAAATADTQEAVKTISNIFGGAELLES